LDLSELNDRLIQYRNYARYSSASFGTIKIFSNFLQQIFMKLQ